MMNENQVAIEYGQNRLSLITAGGSFNKEERDFYFAAIAALQTRSDASRALEALVPPDGSQLIGISRSMSGLVWITFYENPGKMIRLKVIKQQAGGTLAAAVLVAESGGDEKSLLPMHTTTAG